MRTEPTEPKSHDGGTVEIKAASAVIVADAPVVPTKKLPQGGFRRRFRQFEHAWMAFEALSPPDSTSDQKVTDAINIWLRAHTNWRGDISRWTVRRVRKLWRSRH
jgi:hypothetical protein